MKKVAKSRHDPPKKGVIPRQLLPYIKQEQKTGKPPTAKRKKKTGSHDAHVRAGVKAALVRKLRMGGLRPPAPPRGAVGVRV